MIKSGLVSITFRQLSVDEIIDIVSKSGLEAIEWGGDVHVPPGDIDTAKSVYSKTAAAGLEVAAYGSYYRVGTGMDFEPVLKSAIALNAPTIRVWAGECGSEDATDEIWRRIIDESAEIAQMAELYDIKVAYEYHGNTLTDTNEAALRLLKAVDSDNIFTYWQPPHIIPMVEKLYGLDNILPWLDNVHVFMWKAVDGVNVRYDLSAGHDMWMQFLSRVKDCEDVYAMLEFVKDDTVEQFYKDAGTLKDWIEEVNNGN